MTLLLEILFYNGNEIILLTGRDEEHYGVTASWLEKHSISYNWLIMRPAGCREDDDTLKVRMLEENLTPEDRSRIVTIFEDRRRIVDSLRAAGYHVCQVAPGEF